MTGRRWMLPAAIGIVVGLVAGMVIADVSGDSEPTTTIAAPSTTAAPSTVAPAVRTVATIVPSTIPASSGRINTPAADTTVRMEQIVSGTVGDVPAGNKVWVVVQIGVFYPQDGPMNVLPDGRWTGTAFVGATGDAGKTFVLHVVETGPEGTAQFGDYLRRGRELRDFPGIFQDKLATDVRFLDSVSVTRG